jgi:hypothetical protein
VKESESILLYEYHLKIDSKICSAKNRTALFDCLEVIEMMIPRVQELKRIVCYCRPDHRFMCRIYIRVTFVHFSSLRIKRLHDLLLSLHQLKSATRCWEERIDSIIAGHPWIVAIPQKQQP